MKTKEVIDKEVYGGNVSIYKSNKKEWTRKLKGIKRISGHLYISSDVELSAPKLESVGGDLYISSEIDKKLERRLWKHNSKNKWYMTNHCSDWLLSQKGNITYKINEVVFPKSLFDKVRKDSLTAKQVFLIKNMEQRRVAYELMRKRQNNIIDRLINRIKRNDGELPDHLKGDNQ